VFSGKSDEILITLRKIIRAVDLHSKALLKQYGLTGPQLLILTELGKQKENTVSNIARQISLSQATVTSILGRLERQDFVRRSRDQVDKRKVFIQATERTRSILADKPSLLQLDFVRRFNRLDCWEQNLLLSSLQRIASLMDAEKISATPLLYDDSAVSGAEEQPEKR
jgi:DNA-binding MarR family transcriptional regulator